MKATVIIKNSFYTLLFLLSIVAYSQKNTLEKKVIEDMKYMLEEEKLAKDVYTFLGNTLGLKIFENIKQGEERHFDVMKNLLTTNEISFEIHKENGTFYNPELQKLYDYLIQLGSNSIKDVINVGVLIEETDIRDLEKVIKNTNDPYTKQVYSNLLRASKNHLRAFNRQLSKY
ncbi:DUF2202 domain-containing protein [uncultured Aquimarina sp.]|uniref:DUF2202 domain-containing protein n=1 Tax=uncultured Aquimarina sp. TaxID=575652 RepID=UPI0026095B8B|nr:DUF2202 domain-containing protein [uncultured Aquimarina sp.]